MRCIFCRTGHPDTTAFATGIDKRDVFLGKHGCVICGVTDENMLQHCHIIGRSNSKAVRVQSNSCTGIRTVFIVDVSHTVGIGPGVKPSPALEPTQYVNGLIWREMFDIAKLLEDTP